MQMLCDRVGATGDHFVEVLIPYRYSLQTLPPMPMAYSDG